MKRLLMTTAALALLATAAHAKPAQLPAEMLGAWCPDPEAAQSEKVAWYTRATAEQAADSPDCITVSQTEYHGIEDQCEFRSIKVQKLNPWTLYIVRARCVSAGSKPAMSVFNLMMLGSDLVLRVGGEDAGWPKQSQHNGDVY